MRRDAGIRTVSRAEAIERIARIFSAVPELQTDTDTLRRTFQLVTGFAPADRWLPQLAADVHAKLRNTLPDLTLD
jgi:hypothetical protein